MKTFAIAGHLGATPTLETKGKTSWADLRVAVNGAKGHTDWFWITAFGPLAEAICKCLVKGSGIAVNGELRTEEHLFGRERVDVEIVGRRAATGKRRLRPCPSSSKDDG